ncbi:hypothetical protein T492DRAFT_95278 [Pavlovales sp. CCMP2436]|nr:hypothetical protein T492DRAFT_95278 [Pavlovales sp. CCMP2436]
MSKPAASEQLEQELFARLVRATRLSNGLPAPGDDLEFCATFPGFRGAQAAMRARLLGLVSQVLAHRGAVALRSDVGDDEAYERLVDMSDRMLEQADLAHDGATGINNATQHTVVDEPADSAPKSATAAAQAKQLLRPQLKWQGEIDNSDAPFVPKLRAKPNAIVPLDQSMTSSLALSARLASAAPGGPGSAAERRPSEDLGALLARGGDADHPALRRAAALRAHASDLGLVGSSAGGPNLASAYSFGHPYDAEVAAFAPSERQLAVKAEQLYRPLHETPCDWVDTPEGVEEMLAHLIGQPEIALDVEHHSMHSYRGFRCACVCVCVRACVRVRV